jgi:SAM-dependent methyltransferase
MSLCLRVKAKDKTKSSSMSIDILDLESFYRADLGQRVAAQVQTALADLPSALTRFDFGLGYTAPFANMPILMPAQQGSVQSALSTILVDEFMLPLRDQSQQAILAAHFIEHSRDGEHALREIWRVLQPEGRLVLLVANRRGFWARRDGTPFGTGRPYSRTQLRHAAQAAGFVPVGWSSALHFPILRRFTYITPATERLGRLLLSDLAGLLLVELIKRVPAPVKMRQSKLRFATPIAQPALRREKL